MVNKVRVYNVLWMAAACCFLFIGVSAQTAADTSATTFSSDADLAMAGMGMDGGLYSSMGSTTNDQLYYMTGSMDPTATTASDNQPQIDVVGVTPDEAVVLDIKAESSATKTDTIPPELSSQLESLIKTTYRSETPISADTAMSAFNQYTTGQQWQAYTSSYTSGSNQMPANDQCSSAQQISLPANVQGTTNGATRDVGLPRCSGVPNVGKGVWYRLTGTGTRVTLVAFSPGFSPSITVFCGDCPSAGYSQQQQQQYSNAYASAANALPLPEGLKHSAQTSSPYSSSAYFKTNNMMMSSQQPLCVDYAADNYFVPGIPAGNAAILTFCAGAGNSYLIRVASTEEGVTGDFRLLALNTFAACTPACPEAPQTRIIAPPPAFIGCKAYIPAGQPGAYALTGEPRISPSAMFTASDVTVPLDCPDRFTVARTFRATQQCRAPNTALQAISVVDNQPPKIVAGFERVPGSQTQYRIICRAIDTCDPNPSIVGKLIVRYEEVSQTSNNGRLQCSVRERVLSSMNGAPVCGSVVDIRFDQQSRCAQPDIKGLWGGLSGQNSLTGMAQSLFKGLGGQNSNDLYNLGTNALKGLTGGSASSTTTSPNTNLYSYISNMFNTIYQSNGYGYSSSSDTVLQAQSVTLSVYAQDRCRNFNEAVVTITGSTSAQNMMGQGKYDDGYANGSPSQQMSGGQVILKKDFHYSSQSPVQGGYPSGGGYYSQTPAQGLYNQQQQYNPGQQQYNPGQQQYNQQYNPGQELYYDDQQQQQQQQQYGGGGYQWGGIY